jgi:hypothetical protein
MMKGRYQKSCGSIDDIARFTIKTMLFTEWTRIRLNIVDVYRCSIRKFTENIQFILNLVLYIVGCNLLFSWREW